MKMRLLWAIARLTKVSALRQEEMEIQKKKGQEKWREGPIRPKKKSIDWFHIPEQIACLREHKISLPKKQRQDQIKPKQKGPRA